MNEEMDKVDLKQQHEIEALQEKDKWHDFFIKLLAIGIVGWLMVITTVMMIRLTQMNIPKTDLSISNK